MFMSDAIAQAKQAAEINEVPVGAVIVYKNKIISRGHNLVQKSNNALAHAEILVITHASKLLSTKYLMQCDLYTTLEPCPMCAYAISLAKIRRLYFAAFDIKNGAVEHGIRMFSCRTCYVPEIYSGIMEKEARTILQQFFTALRK